MDEFNGAAKFLVGVYDYLKAMPMHSPAFVPQGHMG